MGQRFRPNVLDRVGREVRHSISEHEAHVLCELIGVDVGAHTRVEELPLDGAKVSGVRASLPVTREVVLAGRIRKHHRGGVQHEKDEHVGAGRHGGRSAPSEARSIFKRSTRAASEQK